MSFFAINILIHLFVSNSLAVGNHQNEVKFADPPCFFNPLCTCSRAYPDLGRVTCTNVPLLNIPRQINMSKVFMIHLENNGLHYVEPNFFRGTGLFKIEITRNLLSKISDESFTGLERSLWELTLQHNVFRKVPSQSFRNLHKLKLLDLSDNEIANIKAEDWAGLNDSLKILRLGGNKIFSLRPKTFSTLRQLESLDLSRNGILELDALVFKGGPMHLSELDLAGNLLQDIPINQISELRELRYLDLSFNRITEILDTGIDGSKAMPATVFLDTLRLDHNQIQHLPARAFEHFPNLNRTYLNGNPLTNIQRNAFRRSKVRELHLKDCEISSLPMDAFSGLETHLEILNLEGNNLTDISRNAFKNYTSLKSLNVKNNYIDDVDFYEIFDAYRPPLRELDISYQKIFKKLNLRNFDRINNLRFLSISVFPEASLTANNLPEFFSQLEELKISFSNINNVKTRAFQNVRGLRRLDLSENSISSIDNDAFSEGLHSLVFLSLANSLSARMSRLAENMFEGLASLEILDLSDNNIKSLPQTIFYDLKRLKRIYLQDNFIEFIPRGIFQMDVHSELRTIYLSFNQLMEIQSNTFVALNSLESIWLNDNTITTIQKRAFMNLNQLRHLYLRGNRLKYLSEEAFQDLPELENLDLAYNSLNTFNYTCLEQVGTLSSFTLDLSFNHIDRFNLNTTVSEHSNYTPLYVNIKDLNLSHNNISYLGSKAFKPVEPSITHLRLAANKLRNMTKSAFGNMMHLQWLDVSNNLISEIEYDSFENTKSVQVLYLSNNLLKDVPKQLLKGLYHLRIVDLSGNVLRSLQENLFGDGHIEKLDVSNNQFTKVPVFSFTADSGRSLVELNLSENLIISLPSSSAFARFQNLCYLNLSKNRIIRIEDGTFSQLNRLRGLDLSHNGHLTFDSSGATFRGLDDTLESLSLKNLSMNDMPGARLYSLETLDISDNNISTIRFDVAPYVPELRRLGLGRNRLTGVPPALTAFTKLQCLDLSGNPLDTINFPQTFTVREIDIRNVSLISLEKGALGKVTLLQKVKLTIDDVNQHLNLPNLLRDNHALEDLDVEVLEIDGSIRRVMSGSFPSKFQNLTLIGGGLTNIPNNLLRGIRSPVFTLTLFNTSVEEISKEVFENAQGIRNLSLNLKSNKLKTLYNPNTADVPNTPKKMFLYDFRISANNWICECTIGWIEGWQRKKRHYVCTDREDGCFLSSDDMRGAVCTNRRPHTISDVLKTELECGWNSSPSLGSSPVIRSLIIISMWCHLLIK